MKLLISNIFKKHMENAQENKKNQLNIGLSIIVAGVIIAGAILLNDKTPNIPTAATNTEQTAAAIENSAGTIKPVSIDDHILGNINSKVVMIEYADYQCPFCGKFYTETVQPIEKNYVETGKIAFVYRDFTFLGSESVKAGEAVECANDQGKYWMYHNYLYTHQNGENQGGFADKNLKTFAETLGLNTTEFNTCLDSGKYTQKVKDSTEEASSIGVNGTPHTFIIKNGKVVSEVKGAYPLSEVTAKLDAALK